MKLELLDSNQFASVFRRDAASYRVSIFVHVLTEPYLSYLLSAPPLLRRYDEVYLDGDKYKINMYAVERLRDAGFSEVWFVDKLHVKLVVVGPVESPLYFVLGSGNLSKRSLENFELMMLVRSPDAQLAGRLRAFVEEVRRHRYIPERKLESAEAAGGGTDGGGGKI